MNKYFDGTINSENLVKTELDAKLEEEVMDTVKAVEDNMESLHISNALSEIWNIISKSNKYIDETAPWTLAKSENEEDREKLKSVMYHLIENLRIVAILLQPFMPETPVKMFEQLKISDEEIKTWESTKTYGVIKGDISVIEKGEPLFIRLDMDEEVEYIKNGMNQ